MKTITLFGDSILYGIIVNPDTLKYAKSPGYDLRKEAEKLGFDLLNVSQMGRNSAEGIEAVELYLTRHPAPDYAIIEFGGNDCDRNWAEIARGDRGRVKLTETQFKQNLLNMVSTLSSRGTKVALMNMPPVSSEPFFNWVAPTEDAKRAVQAYLGDVEQIYKTHENYSNIISELAHELNIPLIDARGKFNNDTTLLCIDGVHPNPDGYKLIKQSLIEYLKSL